MVQWSFPGCCIVANSTRNLLKSTAVHPKLLNAQILIDNNRVCLSFIFNCFSLCLCLCKSLEWVSVCITPNTLNMYVCISYYLGCLNAPLFVGLLSLCQLSTNKKLKYPFLSPRPCCHMIIWPDLKFAKTQSCFSGFNLRVSGSHPMTLTCLLSLWQQPPGYCKWEEFVEWLHEALLSVPVH